MGGSINSYLRKKNDIFSLFVGLKPSRPIQTVARIWDIGWRGDSGPEKNGYRPDETGMALARVPPSAQATGSHPASAASGGHHCAGVTLFEFYPVDDVPRITEGFGGWGLNLVEDKRGLLKIS